MAETGSLAAVQSAFAAALEGRGDDAIAAMIKPMDGVPAGIQLDIYRNNIHAALTRSCQGLYPALYALVGEGFFHQMMRDYHRLHRPTHGRMVDYGHDLPAFLESDDFRNRYEAANRHPYFADIARLELASFKMLSAPEMAPLDPAFLANIPPQDVESLHFDLAPYACLLASPWPVLDIYKMAMAAAEGDDSASAPSLADNPARLLIIRLHGDVEIIPLSYGDFSFLMSLDAGAALGESAAAAFASQNDFDLSSALSQALSMGVFASFTEK
ncbi:MULTISPECIES: DNA-binding domain-containing protein [unclassified Iodidimonas]|jgi:hypothetical protein|uniref:DNA-binding domain-containing protein n=1 Tax=unclassified Iodidimonas TaxID=2626145 RepID=UPI00248265D7|nr:MULTISPECIES: DNA-binding domain-containing protein [unclassified Iodidimonas]